MLTGIFVLLGGLLAVGACGVIWYFRGQNKLVKAEELCGNSLSQIGIQQASRWDALSTMAQLVQGYSSQEYTTLMHTIEARRGIGAKTSAAEVDGQEALLMQGLGRVTALAEAYPDLKSNTLYLKAMDEVHRYEDNVRMSRMVYNDSVTKYNRLVRGLPGAWVAQGLGFAPREYLEADPAKATLPPVMP